MNFIWHVPKRKEKAIRSISNAKYNDNIMQLFASLEILPYPKMQKQAKLLFMHGIEYQHGPESFRETWTKNENRNAVYELRNANLFETHRVNYTYLKIFPLFAFPAEWNKLEIEIKLQRNKCTFQKALKSKLLSELDQESEQP